VNLLPENHEGIPDEKMSDMPGQAFIDSTGPKSGVASLIDGAMDVVVLVERWSLVLPRLAVAYVTWNALIPDWRV